MRGSNTWKQDHAGDIYKGLRCGCFRQKKPNKGRIQYINYELQAPPFPIGGVYPEVMNENILSDI
jgi:hypothetical protein